VVFHDDVDEVVDGCCDARMSAVTGGEEVYGMGLTVFVSYQHFAVEHLVVPQDVVEHLLVEVFRRGLEGDLHAACFLHFQVDVPTPVNRVRLRKRQDQVRTAVLGSAVCPQLPVPPPGAPSVRLSSLRRGSSEPDR